MPADPITVRATYQGGRNGSPRPTGDSVNPMSEREIGLGVQPIEELNDQKMTLVRKAATLFGVYGAGGTASDRKKSALADLENSIRAVADGMGEKMTEAGVARAALSHKSFKELTADTEKARSELYVLEKEIECIDATINRGQRMLKNPEGF